MEMADDVRVDMDSIELSPDVEADVVDGLDCTRVGWRDCPPRRKSPGFIIPIVIDDDVVDDELATAVDDSGRTTGLLCMDVEEEEDDNKAGETGCSSGKWVYCEVIG